MEAILTCLVWALLAIAGRVVAIEIHDTGYRPRPTDKECYGTNMRFSYSGSPDFHYSALRRRYSGCTYVQGNLEITHLYSENITYDLSFLSGIRVVTGYVLLGLLTVDTIPLTDLRLIRADNNLSLFDGFYGLAVVLTAEKSPSADGHQRGLRELQLPALREISQGNVLFSQNPTLCYVNTIAWDVIVQNHKTPVDIKPGGLSDDCPACPQESADYEGIPRCWGLHPALRQEVERVECDSLCPGRCRKKGILGCCHPECAIGCSGPLNTECEMCKYFRYREKCVSRCPQETYPLGQECVEA